MTAPAIAGLSLRRNTLDWKTADGEIAAWSGYVEVAANPECLLSRELRLEIAKFIAYKELPNCVEVDQDGWTVLCNEGDVIRLVPNEWSMTEKIEPFHSCHCGERCVC